VAINPLPAEFYDPCGMWLSNRLPAATQPARRPPRANLGGGLFFWRASVSIIGERKDARLSCPAMPGRPRGIKPPGACPRSPGTSGASAVTAEVAKKCDALTAKAYPPRVLGDLGLSPPDPVPGKSNRKNTIPISRVLHRSLYTEGTYA
jgi:hypothetical protein